MYFEKIKKERKKGKKHEDNWMDFFVFRNNGIAFCRPLYSGRWVERPFQRRDFYRGDNNGFL